MMNELSYWLLRCGNELFTTSDTDHGNVFPRGPASDFGNPERALLVGEWQNLPCYAAEIERIPENIPGELVGSHVKRQR
jgi:hypothetical protein